MNLGERIAEQRIKRGYSQVELGNCLSVDFFTVASWEAGVSIPNVDALIKISEVLDVSTDYLLKGQEETLDSVVVAEKNNAPRSENGALFNSELDVSGKRVGTKQKNAKRKTTLIVCACVGLIAVCLLAAVIHRDSVKRFFENSVSNSTIESSQTVDKDKMREEETMSLSDVTKSVVYLEMFDENNELIGSASGFLIEDGMTLVTNYHVIENAHSIVASLKDGTLKTRCNTVLAYDIGKDLAVLRCFNYLKVDSLVLGESNTVSQGDTIYAIGYPLGLENTISDGIVSSIYTDDFGAKIVQITAAISGGCSGGPVINGRGEVVGIICAYYESAQNLNVAISVNELKGLLNKRNDADAMTLEEMHNKKLQYALDVLSLSDNKHDYIPATIEDLFYYPEYYNGQYVAVKAWNAFMVDNRGPESVRDYIEAILIDNKEYFVGNRKLLKDVDNDEFPAISIIAYFSNYIKENYVPYVSIIIHNSFITDSSTNREVIMTVFGKFTYDPEETRSYQIEVCSYSYE